VLQVSHWPDTALSRAQPGGRWFEFTAAHYGRFETRVRRDSWVCDRRISRFRRHARIFE